ncbi:MAG TPA: hypothetical protein VN259_09385, partial [Xanthomonadales bacterium]|nr:hypothetical protein [Xanthomonadales bacterium]
MKPIRNAPAPVALDFGTSRRLPNWVGWLILALGLMAVCGALFKARSDYIDVEERAAIIERLRAQSGAPGASAAPANYESGPVLAVAALLNANWAGVIADLAQAQGTEVKLLEVQADAARGGLRIVGEVPTLEAAFSYIERLQAQGVLRSATLDSHVWEDAGGVAIVRFTASARWG